MVCGVAASLGSSSRRATVLQRRIPAATGAGQTRTIRGQWEVEAAAASATSASEARAATQKWMRCARTWPHTRWICKRRCSNGVQQLSSAWRRMRRSGDCASFPVGSLSGCFTSKRTRQNFASAYGRPQRSAAIDPGASSRRMTFPKVCRDCSHMRASGGPQDEAGRRSCGGDRAGTL